VEEPAKTTAIKFRAGRALLDSVFLVALAFTLFFAVLFVGTPWTREYAVEFAVSAGLLGVPLVLLVWRGRYNKHKWELSGRKPSFKAAVFCGSMFVLSAAMRAADALQSWEGPVLKTHPLGVAVISLQLLGAMFLFHHAWKVKKDTT
jgi:hypothetical protein